MNQKSVIVLVLLAIVAIFLGFLAAGERTPAAQFGESTTVQEETNIQVENESEAVTKPQGKIDVRVACESALMYTTFTDGAAADAFVTECIEGKHPEVIERYISDMGVDGAMI